MLNWKCSWTAEWSQQFLKHSALFYLHNNLAILNRIIILSSKTLHNPIIKLIACLSRAFSETFTFAYYLALLLILKIPFPSSCRQITGFTVAVLFPHFTRSESSFCVAWDRRKIPTIASCYPMRTLFQRYTWQTTPSVINICLIIV